MEGRKPPRTLLGFACCLFFIMGLVLDIFVFQNGSDLPLFSLLMLWIAAIILTRWGPQKTLKVSIALLLVLWISYISNVSVFVSERAATWLYLTLWVTVFHQGVLLLGKRKRT